MHCCLTNLDVDPVFLALSDRGNKKRNADGIRLWAKFFVPPGMVPSFNVPEMWSDFFISSILNPSQFDWAKTFLSSEEWSVILGENAGEVCISFSLPPKCPVKEKLECACLTYDRAIEEIEQVNEANSALAGMEGEEMGLVIQTYDTPETPRSLNFK
jgi:hypothetical protein